MSLWLPIVVQKINSLQHMNNNEAHETSGHSCFYLINTDCLFFCVQGWEHFDVTEFQGGVVIVVYVLEDSYHQERTQKVFNCYEIYRSYSYSRLQKKPLFIPKINKIIRKKSPKRIFLTLYHISLTGYYMGGVSVKVFTYMVHDREI